MNNKILVLGISGMVGRIVFSFLKINFPDSVFGTVKDKNDVKKDLFLFRAEYAEKDFYNIYKKFKKIDYVINCIGAKDEKEISKLVFVNSYFPHVLSNLCEKFNFKLIHISTDAVFDPMAGPVSEKNVPIPKTLYGMSKLLGEQNRKNTITIRTSIIGFNPLDQNVLLERITKNKDNLKESFLNQKWSGCTTLQFAFFCKNIISNNYFNKLKNKSCVFHFAPLGPITRFELIYEFLKLNGSSFNLKKIKTDEKNMFLATIYFDILKMGKYTNDIKKALFELIKHEEKT